MNKNEESYLNGVELSSCWSPRDGFEVRITHLPKEEVEELKNFLRKHYFAEN